MQRTIERAIKCQLVILVLLVFGSPARAQVTISPSTPPVANQGQTITFTASVAGGGSVTWSCPGCQGSIDSSTGIYTAPAVVNSQQSYGGCQLLPNDHIYNTRIDSLPVNANSAAWIAGAGTVPLNYLPSWNVNYVDSSTPTANMVFYYEPANNGSFVIPQYPKARIQSGWFTYLSTKGGYDRHFFMINPATCAMQELYNYYPAGYNSQCPTCTSQSGLKYNGSDYALPANGATDAAGMFVMPQMLRVQELEQAIATGGTINHALRVTLANGYINNSFIWPATAHASSGGGVIPYGARFRLKASFDISKFSIGAQVLLTQLKQYGIILGDGGYGWQIGTEDTYRQDQFQGGISPGSIFYEILAANIAPTNFEAVDESGLMVSPSSGATTNSETVVATSSKGSAKRQIVLTGVTLNLPKDALYIQAGTAAEQFVAFVNGSSNREVTWTMNPTVGTLTSGGLYTPPSNVSSTSIATVMATSQANPKVAATMQLSVFPTGPIRIILGSKTPYTDSQGNVWQPRSANGGGGDNANYGVTAVAGTWSGADSQLYKYTLNSYEDMTFEFTVPNGTYQVTEKYGEPSGLVAGERVMSLEAQGVTQVPNLDLAASVGDNVPKDFTFNVTVMNNDLHLVNRFLQGYGPVMSALQIVPVPGTGANPPTQPPPAVKVIEVK